MRPLAAQAEAARDERLAGMLLLHGEGILFEWLLKVGVVAALVAMALYIVWNRWVKRN